MINIKKVIPTPLKQCLGKVKSNLSFTFQIMEQSFVELKDAFCCRKHLSHLNDYAYLESYILKNAHILEKEVKNLFQDRKKHFNHEGVCRNLKNSLQKLHETGYSESETIKWAEKILKEYEKHVGSGWVCEKIGKTSDKVASANLLSLLKERRSIRVWKDESLNFSEIDKLIDAARWAPSSCNRQTLHFLIVDDKKLISDITETVKGADPFFKKAPLFIITLVDFRPYNIPSEKYTMYQDAAAAIQNMLLMVHDMGLGACWASYTSDTGIIIDEYKTRSKLGIPKYFKIAGLIAVGKPNEQACLIPRREIKGMISINRFGSMSMQSIKTATKGKYYTLQKSEF